VSLPLSNLAVYSVQLAVLVAAAAVMAALLRLRSPLSSLRFWQAILAAAIMLPLVQPWTPSSPPSMLTASVTFVSEAAPPAALAARGIDWTEMLLAAIAIGIAARLAWLALGLFRLRTITARATPAPDALAKLAIDLSHDTGSAATVLVTDAVATPATIGLANPRILVPTRLAGMSERVQRAVITHELVHVRRRDWLHTIGEELWCAMLWFHPAARAIAMRLSLARETVVDEHTLRLTRDRRAYAEALLAFADPQPHIIGLTPLIGRRQLSQRVTLIAEEVSMSRRRLLSSLVAALVVTATATAAAAVTFPLSSKLEQYTKVFKPGNGVTLPEVVKEVKPVYTPDAMQRRVQGSVWLDVVVLDTGKVGDVTVTKALDEDLDQEAIKAAKQWEFKPGTYEGKPVAVQVVIELTFTLKK
jgi:TonB family protein